MIIEKSVSKTYERLFVQSSIFLDNYTGICGRPFITLHAYKDAISEEWYGPYEIYINIYDYDDFGFGYGYVYRMQNEEEFFNVLHELVNLMKDHEQGIIYWDDVISDNLFPEFKSAERVVW
ncbi:hypothetical protein RO865_17955 [Blautia faecis]|uniref:hypothetical protein n=1 Tax=Blautia faecis TaxID=871665 RepID=UPI0028A4C914|nr:hypothetical protein [Blautia faecis]MDT4370659.1 hypothetical protein [Blautia faecis]